MSGPRVVAIVAVALAVVAVAAGVAGLMTSAPGGTTSFFLLSLCASIPAFVLGLALVRRLPHHPAGALLALAGLALVVTVNTDVAATVVALIPGHSSFAAVWAALTQGSWMLLYIPWAWLVLIFPDGHLRGRFGRATAVMLPLVYLLFSLSSALSPSPYLPPFESTPHPFGTVAIADIVSIALLPIFLALLICSAVSAFIRYRTADPASRVQLRWLAVAGLSIPATLLLCWLGFLVFHDPAPVIVGLLVMNIALPGAIGIALLRANVFDVDRVLVNTIATAVVIAVLIVVVAGASGIADLLDPRSALFIAVAVTALAVLLMLPLRGRLARWLRRIVNPARERAIDAVRELHHRVDSGDAQPEELEGVLRLALADPSLRLGYRLPGHHSLVDSLGAPVEENPLTARIVVADRTIGAVIPGATARTPPPREVIAVATMVVEMARLRLELATALREVAASRARLLRAGYIERQRLERDLHDGAQQRLVALGMSLRLFQRHLAPEATTTRDLLDEAVAELGTAVAELRQIAHGLRPSSLDDGLTAALTNLSSTSAMPIDLQLDAQELPDAISTTAYFVASEAVVNAVKYAEAERISLRVAQRDDVLHIQVRDDGCGGAVMRPGGGLAGLSDRVSALGGVLRIESPAGSGTLVEAVLPCGS